MHYGIIVMVPKEKFATMEEFDPEYVNGVLEPILDPFDENQHFEEHEVTCYCQYPWSKRDKTQTCEHCNGTGTYMSESNPQGRWDWWQFGGRWTGFLTDYDPTKDEGNKETCTRCKGSGKDCNYCNNTGLIEKWPTSWNKYPGDVLPVEKLIENHKVKDKTLYAVIDRNGVWWNSESKDTWLLEDAERKLAERERELEWGKKFNELLEEHRDCYAVVVDVHN
jgi:hypothetical protein